MGKKYIIELNDECNSEFKGIMVFGLSQEKQISVELISEESLTPYTEPDLDAIKQEEYEKGYKTAKVQCNIQAEKDLREVGDRHYQKGLNDAWEAARKIGSNSMCSLKEMGFDFSQCAVPDYNPSWFVVKNYSASEAIEKIRQYEQEKEEQIQVGDEVNAPFGKAIVVNIDLFAKKIWLVYADGHGGFEYFKDAPTKTGRHFPEIAKVLQKMREGQEQ